MSDDALAMNAFTNEVSDFMLNTIKTTTKKGEKVLDLQKEVKDLFDLRKKMLSKELKSELVE